jgi:hypothetical protein
LTNIEAMKQALEALGSYMEATDSEADAEAHSLMAAAFFKLKEAVAEAEKQEPYGYVSIGDDPFFQKETPDIGRWETVYTTPPAAQRKPLTDHQITQICVDLWSGGWRETAMRNFARAIEAAHGIGEKNT